MLRLRRLRREPVGYRDPAVARSVHKQDAAYLDVIHDKPAEWNPADYAYHLTRRARGLPLWFSLSVHGVNAYTDAIETAIMLAREAAGDDRSRSRSPDCSGRGPVMSAARDGQTSAAGIVWPARKPTCQSSRVIRSADGSGAAMPRGTLMPVSVPGRDARRVARCEQHLSLHHHEPGSVIGYPSKSLIGKAGAKRFRLISLVCLVARSPQLE